MVKDGLLQSFLKDAVLEICAGLFGNLLVQNEIADLLAGNEMPQLLQHLLSLGGQCGQRIDGSASPAPGAVAEALNFGGFVGGEAEQRFHFLVDVVGLLAKIAFSDAIEVSLDFRGEPGDGDFGLRDGDFEVAGGDFFPAGFGGEEGD